MNMGSRENALQLGWPLDVRSFADCWMVLLSFFPLILLLTEHALTIERSTAFKSIIAMKYEIFLTFLVSSYVFDLDEEN